MIRPFLYNFFEFRLKLPNNKDVIFEIWKYMSAISVEKVGYPFNLEVAFVVKY